MKQLIVSDLHLTSNAVDSYRWDIFDFLEKVIEENVINQLIILGDLTEKKDNHNSDLLNEMINELLFLDDSLPLGIYILQGNHDFSQSDYDYWEFLNHLKGNIVYVNKAFYDHCCDAFFLPFKEDFEPDICENPIIFTHKLFTGAKYGNICAKNGINVPNTERHLIISGHIHSPQKIINRRGLVYYVGAPYSVDFGDHYQGRVLIRNTETNILESIPTNMPIKWNISIKHENDLSTYPLKSEDFIKITYQCSVEEFEPLLKKTQRYLEQKNITLSGSTFQDIKFIEKKEQIEINKKIDDFSDFCHKQELSKEYIEVGQQFLKDNS